MISTALFPSRTWAMRKAFKARIRFIRPLPGSGIPKSSMTAWMSWDSVRFELRMKAVFTRSSSRERRARQRVVFPVPTSPVMERNPFRSAIPYWRKLSASRCWGLGNRKPGSAVRLNGCFRNP